VRQAARSCDTEALAVMLKEHGASFLSQWRDAPAGWSLAHIGAAEADGIDLLRWLHEHRICLTAESSNNSSYANKRSVYKEFAKGSTCLHMAAAYGRLEAARFIVEHTDSTFVAHKNMPHQQARDVIGSLRGPQKIDMQNILSLQSADSSNTSSTFNSEQSVSNRTCLRELRRIVMTILMLI
jgi:hypothetical protein